MSDAVHNLPILLIEDEDAVMAFLQAVLDRNGYPTVCATSGAEGLKLLEEGGEFLGIITDMRTPGGVSGADVHAWLVRNRPQLATRLIFITGDTVNLETQAVLTATRAPCIEKPFSMQQLISAVQQHLSGSTLKTV